jgi:RNA polymerase sigma factor (sigma-70 family)
MRTSIALLAAIALVAVAMPASAGGHGHSERLAARARRGDRVARTTLVEEHMGIVRSVARRYRDLGIPVDDLVQEGAIGLLGAVDDYDAQQGTSFSTYAFWRVRAAVTHALTARGSLVRVPRTLLERRREVASARRDLSGATGEPSVRELAAATALDAAQVAEALASPQPVFLDAIQPDGTTLADRLPDERTASPDVVAVSSSERRAVRAALRRLRPFQRTIVKRHFGIDREPETLTKIASDLSLSPERTRALKDEALRDLRTILAGAV